MIRALFLLLLCALNARAERSAESWSKLKLGMSPAEAADALGTPLVRTSSRGFDVWIYDSRAEVVFFGGPVIGWTTPVSTVTPSASFDIWAADAGRLRTETFFLPAPSWNKAPVRPASSETETRVYEPAGFNRYRGAR